VLLIPLCGISSAQTTKDASRASENVRTYRMRWRPTREVVNVLAPIFPEFRFHDDPTSGSLIVEGSPDRLKPIEEAIASLDIPRPEVNLTVHLLWGRRSNLKVPLPKEVAKADAELRKRFKFTKYELANSIYLPALGSSKVKAAILPGFLFECAVDKVEPVTGTLDIRVNVSRVGSGGSQFQTVVETAMRVERGKPVVLGGIPLDPDPTAVQGDLRRIQPDRYLVLVLDADVPQPKLPVIEKDHMSAPIEKSREE
jgi:type II secretory pathway component GspD/PulD (secretin)